MFSVRTTGVVPNRETQFKGHVKRGLAAVAGPVEPGHIVNGILTGSMSAKIRSSRRALPGIVQVA